MNANKLLLLRNCCLMVMLLLQALSCGVCYYCIWSDACKFLSALPLLKFKMFTFMQAQPQQLHSGH